MPCIEINLDLLKYAGGRPKFAKDAVWYGASQIHPQVTYYPLETDKLNENLTSQNESLKIKKYILLSQLAIGVEG